MRDILKVAIAGTALVIAGLGAGARGARAGNAQPTPVQYFSAAIPVGYEMALYFPSPGDFTILVDDVTFSVTQIDPCPTPARCAYFPRGVMAPWYTPDQGGTNPAALNSPPFQVYQYSEARGHDVGMVLAEHNPPANLVAPIDDFWVNTRAEVYAVSTLAAPPPPPLPQDKPFGDVPDNSRVPWGPVLWGGTGGGIPIGGPPPLPPPPPPTPDLGAWELTDAETTSHATETSRSSHFQTPQIVQPSGARIICIAPGARHTVGTAFVKGRIVAATIAPVENTQVR